MPARVTYLLEELADYRPFRIGGSGATRADALAEANAKLAMVCGNLVRASVTDELAAGEGGSTHAGTSFSDVDLVLQNVAKKTKVGIHIENVTTAIALGVDGEVDITNPLVTAFAAAYKDSDGDGGYTIKSGHFVR